MLKEPKKIHLAYFRNYSMNQDVVGLKKGSGKGYIWKSLRKKTRKVKVIS
jgi:hypothetical protein